MPSQADFARHVGITQQAVSKLLTAGILPRSGDLDAWTLAYCEHLRARGERIRERTRLIGLRADLQEMKVATMLGLLMPVEAIERQWSDKVAAVRSRLMSIPGQAARVMGAGSVAEVREILADIVSDALAGLARGAGLRRRHPDMATCRKARGRLEPSG